MLTKSQLNDALMPAVNVSNAYRSWRAYNRTGVLFEAHIFPQTKHCEKDVESEDTVQRYSIPFVVTTQAIRSYLDFQGMFMTHCPCLVFYIAGQSDRYHAQD